MNTLFILFVVISLLVGLSNALTSRDVVKLLKKTTDKHDRAMLKGMVWCKGSHGFHFVFGALTMALMFYGDMDLGMLLMLGVGFAAGLMSLMELWDRIFVEVDEAIDKVIPPEVRASEMLKQLKQRLNSGD